jgi:hypothetical protein
MSLAIGFLFINLVSPTSISVLSGFQRSFACPLFIALIYHLHRENHIAAAVTTVASAAIYPPTFLVVIVTWALHAIEWHKVSRLKLPITKSELRLLMMALFLSAAVLSPLIVSQLTKATDSITSSVPIWQDPQYQADGRYPLFQLFPFVGTGGLVSKGMSAIHLLILLCIGGMILLVRGQRTISPPREIACMLWASLTLFLLAWAAAFVTDSFLLYKPSRYTRASLFLFSLMFVLLNVRGSADSAIALIRHNRHKLIWLIGTVEIIVLALIILYPSNRTEFIGVNMKWLLAPASLLLGVLGALSLGRSRPALSRVRPRQTTAGRVFLGVAVGFALIGWGAYARAISERSGLDPPADERKMLAFLETLPEDILIAGTPCALNNVPLFAKRQILFSCEQMSQDGDLMREALNAYYAQKMQVVLGFCQAHDVDYLVVNRQTYTEEYLDAGWIFFEPYNQELLPCIKSREGFALAQVPEDAKVFQSGDYFVMPCTESPLGE